MNKYTILASVFSFYLTLGLTLVGHSSEKRTWQQTSEQGNFIVELEAPDDDIRLSEFLNWRLVIRDADSKQGVSPVRVVVGGGMPVHGHGLPTQPKVTAHLGDGHYQLEGLMFNMAGRWQLILAINTQLHADRVIFDLTLNH